MVTALALALVGLASESLVPELHPALTGSPSEILKSWEKGWADSSKLKNADGSNKIAKQSIKRHRTSVIGVETSCWLYFLHPKFLAYNLGFVAKRKYWTEEEITKMKEWLTGSDVANPKLLIFFADINLLPDFNRGYGRIGKHADPRDLIDIRVVLKVGNRIYQPLQHPGDLQASVGEQVNLTSVPSFNYGWSNSRATVSGTTPAGKVFGTANVSTSYSEMTQKNSSESYKTYHGSFAVAFSLFDEDGTPRIRKEDKEFTVAVVYTSGENPAKFKLDDWVKAYQ